MKYEFKECLGARLRRMSRIVDLEFRKHLGPFDITENQMTILFVLSKKEELEQGKIGEYLALQRSTVSRNVKLLEKQAFVTKSQDYRPIIKLTNKGKKLVQELTPIWHNIMEILTDKIGKKGMESILFLESKLI